MLKAIPVENADWQHAIKIQDNQSYFKVIQRQFALKQALPAKKMNKVEFFNKP